MADTKKLVICNGDMIQITLNPPCMSPPLVAPLPLVASGFSKVNDQAMCVEGDEYPPPIKNNTPVPYICPPYVVPGTGTVKITLNGDNETSLSKDKDDKKILLHGTPFQVELDVMSPAMMPTPAGPQPDPLPKHTGTAQFITTNTLVTSE